MPATNQNYRFHLPKKAIKSDCPVCGPKHHKTLSRYVDSQTGETLPEQYGRCDRESNCGYHLSPYAKDASGSSYSDEVGQTSSIPPEWFKMAGMGKRPHVTRKSIVNSLTQREGVMPGQAERVATRVFEKQPDKVPASPAPVYMIPDQLFNQSLGHYDQNQFARLLRQQFGIGKANELLQRFQIGTSSRWPGACVFWLIDEQGRKRGGQIKLFDKFFKTVKYVDRTGEKRSKTSWVHSALIRRYQKEQTPVPDWLTTYDEKSARSPCLFGLPQLLTAPANQPIAIVEAPKTAVLCTAYFEKFIWLAAVGRSYLQAERLAPLKGRSIVLFPDLSENGQDYAYWKGKADSFRQQGFNVVVSNLLERLATNEKRAKGYDLADYLLEQWKGYPPEWDVPSSKPAPMLTTSPNRSLADVLAGCLNMPADRMPLYQLASP